TSGFSPGRSARTPRGRRRGRGGRAVSSWRDCPFELSTKCTREPPPPGTGSCARPALARKADPRDEAPALAGEQLESAAVCAHHALDDREAQARAALVAARDLKARERLLQPLGFRLRNARAAVCDLEHRRAVLGAHRDAHLLFPV